MKICHLMIFISFTLVDEAPAHRMSSQGNVASEDDDTESLVRNASDQRAEELQVIRI
jgi:hypothetical protein